MYFKNVVNNQNKHRIDIKIEWSIVDFYFIADDDDLVRAVEWNHFVVGGVGEVSSAQFAPPAACSPQDASPCWLHHRGPRLLVATDSESVEPHMLQAGVGHEHGVEGDEPWVSSSILNDVVQ